MSKSFRLWSREDVEGLRVLYAEKRPLSEIASALQRTPGACENKLFESGIAKRQTVSPIYVNGGAAFHRPASSVDAPRRWWESLARVNLARLEAACAGAGPWMGMAADDRSAEVEMLTECVNAITAKLEPQHGA